MTRQRLALQYRGSVLGASWLVLAPALTLGIYTLVFGLIFKPRWAADSTDTTEYALLLYLGLCVYWFVSECVGEAPSQMRDNANYVKKVVFPLEALAWVSVCTGLVHTILRFTVFAVACLWLQGALPWTLCLLPFFFIPVAFIALAASWAISAIGVFVRDLRELITLALTAMLFLSPVFYRIDSVPESFRWLVRANPITVPIEAIRQVSYFGELPALRWMLIYGATAYLAACLGLALFQRCRPAFPDEL